MIRLLPLAASLLFAFQALAANPASPGGYKGVLWGADCQDALRGLQAIGMRIDDYWFSQVAQGKGGYADLGVEVSQSVAGGRCGATEVLQGAFQREFPYDLADGWAGPLRTRVFCRDGKFVGVTLSVTMDQSRESREGSSQLRQAAGQPVTTRRVSNGIGAVDVNTLSVRDGSARFLAVPVSGSPMAAPEMTYVVIAKSESDAIRASQASCSKAKADQEKKAKADGDARMRSVLP